MIRAFFSLHIRDLPFAARALRAQFAFAVSGQWIDGACSRAHAIRFAPILSAARQIPWRAALPLAIVPTGSGQHGPSTHTRPRKKGP
jgi:hypothetical protein